MGSSGGFGWNDGGRRRGRLGDGGFCEIIVVGLGWVLGAGWVGFDWSYSALLICVKRLYMELRDLSNSFGTTASWICRYRYTFAIHCNAILLFIFR